MNGENLPVPLKFKTPLTIDNIVLEGAQEKIVITSAGLSWDDMGLTLSGTIKPGADNRLQVDLDAAADHVDVEKIMENFGDATTSHDTTAPPFPMPITGAVRFKTGDLKYKTLTIKPLQADIGLQDKTIDITLRDAGLCSIPISGTIRMSSQGIAYHLNAEAGDKQVKSTLNCFTDRHFKADGRYDVKGSFEGYGSVKELLNKTSGQIDLSISDGHIYHDIIALNVIKFLNISRVISDRLSAGQMAEQGLGFKRFETHITLQNGKLQYERLILKANELVLTGIGEIDLIHGKIDFSLLAAPQATVNALLGGVPLVGGILQTMTTIPLRVTGTIDDVHVLPLGPSAVGYKLKELTHQTLGVPMRLVHLDAFRKGTNRGEK